MTTAFVWIDSWQQQCCGHDFAVGSRVSWTAMPQADDEWVGQLLGPEWSERVAWRQETHGGGPIELVSGLVRTIYEVSCRRTAEPRGSAQVMVPVAGSGTLNRIFKIDPWGPDDPEDLSTSFDGWIVELELEPPAE